MAHQRLKEVYSAPVGGDSDWITIVYIPNTVYEGKPTQSHTESSRWASIAPSLSHFNSRLLVFQHDTRLEELFAWRQFFKISLKLLPELYSYYIAHSPCPIFFICEGLGGIILKEALGTAHAYPQRWADLLSAISGVTFLGTPHIANTESECWKHLAVLFRPVLKTVTKKTITPENLSDLYISASKFAAKFAEPCSRATILSGYETVETKLQNKPWKNSQAILVDKNFARIGLAKEVLEGIDVKLSGVLDPEFSSGFRQHILEHISSAVNRAQQELVMNTPSVPSLKALQSPVYSNSMALSSSRLDNQSKEVDSIPSLSSLGISSTTSSERSRLSDSSFVIVPDPVQLPAGVRKVNLPLHYPKTGPRTEHFTGRKDILKDIAKTLLPFASAASNGQGENLKTFVIHGLGGAGKTELARQFMNANKTAYDAVFFIRADNVPRLSEQFNQIAVQLGLESETSRNASDISRETLKTWLENPVRWMKNPGSEVISPVSCVDQQAIAKWLIVFDNADDPTVLSDFWPTAGCGSVLITSRDPMTRSHYFFPTAGVELEGLPLEEAAALLTHLTGNDRRSTEDKVKRDTQAIAQRLEGLPLAIDQIGAIICKQGLTLFEFLDIYEEDKEFFELHPLRYGKCRYEHSLATVWALESLSRGALALLNFISLLDSEIIQEEIFFKTFRNVKIAGFPSSKTDYYEARAHLLETSMVKKHFAENSLRVHGLVQGAAQAKMMASDGLLETNFCQAVRSVAELWPFINKNYVVGSSGKVDRWVQCRKWFPHISQLAHVYKSFLQAKSPMASDVNLVELLTEAAWFQYENTNPDEAAPLQDLALSVCQTLPGDTNPQLSNIHGGKLWVATQTREFQKVFHHAEIRFKIEEALYHNSGKATSKTALAHNDLGMAYSMNGLYEPAISHLNKSKEIRESLEGFRKDWLFSPLHHLALTYWCQRRYSEAADTLLEAIHDRETILGLNDRESIRTGALYYALGNVRNSQGLLDEGCIWHGRALIHFRNTVGDKGPATLQTWYKLAEHDIRYKDYRDAEGKLNRIFDVYRDLPQRRHEIVRATFLAARLFRLTGNNVEAEKMLQRSVTTYNEIKPDDCRTPETLLEEDISNLFSYEFI